MTRRRAEPDDTDEAATSDEYDKFEELPRKLLGVSKSDLDEARKRDEQERRGA